MLSRYQALLGNAYPRSSASEGGKLACRCQTPRDLLPSHMEGDVQRVGGELARSEAGASRIGVSKPELGNERNPHDTHKPIHNYT